MAAEPVDGIAVRRTERGEVWRLPARAPRVLLGGFFLFLASLGFTFAWILGSPTFGGSGEPAPLAARVAAGLLAAGALLPAVLGLAFLRSRGSLVLDRDRVGWREHGGFVRWTHWRDRAAVRAVAWDRSEPGVARPVLRLEGAADLPLAHLDPEPLGHTLARMLADQLDVPLEALEVEGVRGGAEDTGAAGAAPEAADSASASAEASRGGARPAPGDVGGRDGPRAPSGSGGGAVPPGVRVHREGERWTLHVPPQGLLRGSHGLFPFGCVWLAFTSVLATAFVAGGAASDQGLPLALFFTLFFAIGTGMLLAGWNAGRREEWLVVGDDGSLTCRRSGPFGRNERAIAAADLRGVRVGDSNLRVNGRAVRQLEVRHAHGRWTGLRSLRDEDLEAVHAWLEARLAATARTA